MDNPFEIITTTEIVEDTFSAKPDTTVVSETPPTEGNTMVLNPPSEGLVQEVESKPTEAFEEEVEVQEEIKINPYHVAQLHFRDEGLLSEEDVKPDATWDDVQSILEKRVSAKLEQQVAQRLEASGVTEKTLMYAKMIERNQSVQEANELHTLGRIAALREVPDLTQEQKVAVAQNMYKLKGYDPAESAIIIDKIVQDGDLDKLHETSLTFHETQYNTKLQAERSAQAEREAAIIAKQEEETKRLQKAIQDRKVLGYSFSPKVAKSLVSDIYNQDTEYEVGGEKRVGSKVDAFFAKFYQSDEQKLLTYLRHAYPEEFEAQTTKKAKKTIEEEILNTAKTKVVKKEEETEDHEMTWTVVQ